MARLAPLARNAVPDLDEDFAFFERTLGFVPNSLLTMARRPSLARGLIALSRGVYDPKGEVDLGLKRLLGHTASNSTNQYTTQYGNAITVTFTHGRSSRSTGGSTCQRPYT